MRYYTHIPFIIVGALGALLTLPAAAVAQVDRGAWHAAAVVAAADSDEFKETEAGIGGRIGWTTLSRLIGVEAELTFYPGDLPDSQPFSSSRVEGFFGGTFGPQLGRFRPFARLRPGFLHYADAPEPLACIAIFPPPLSCELAEGATLPALDIGGGVEFDMADRGLVRLDLGNRLVRYDGPVRDGDGEVRDDAFWSHGLRFAASVGLRF